MAEGLSGKLEAIKQAQAQKAAEAGKIEEAHGEALEEDKAREVISEAQIEAGKEDALRTELNLLEGDFTAADKESVDAGNAIVEAEQMLADSSLDAETREAIKAVIEEGNQKISQFKELNKKYRYLAYELAVLNKNPAEDKISNLLGSGVDIKFLGQNGEPEAGWEVTGIGTGQVWLKNSQTKAERVVPAEEFMSWQEQGVARESADKSAEGGKVAEVAPAVETPVAEVPVAEVVPAIVESPEAARAEESDVTIPSPESSSKEIASLALEEDPSIEELKLQYDIVVEKIKVSNAKVKELRSQIAQLDRERSEVENTGDTQKLEEIGKKREEVYQQTIVHNREILDQEFEAKKLVLEFKKHYGYDEAVAKEASDKLGHGSARTDANRLVMNKYLGIELPIISRDLKLATGQDWLTKKDTLAVVDDDSPDGIRNISFLIEKRADLLLEVIKKQSIVNQLPLDIRNRIIAENKLAWDALNELQYDPGSNQTKEHWQNENISDVFSTFVNGETIYGDSRKKLTPQASEKMKKAGYDSGFSLSVAGDYYSTVITRVLFIYKIAKEKGLI